MISVVKANKAEMTQNVMRVRGQVLLYRVVRREVLCEVKYEQSPECWVEQVMWRWGWECWEKNIRGWGNSRCKGWRVNLRAEEGASLVLSEPQRGEWTAQEQEEWVLRSEQNPDLLGPWSWYKGAEDAMLMVKAGDVGLLFIFIRSLSLLHEESGHLSIPFSSRKNKFLLISWEVWSTSPCCYEKKETNFFVDNDSNSEFNILSYNI